MLRSSLIGQLGIFDRKTLGFIAVSSAGREFAQRFLPRDRVEIVKNPLPPAVDNPLRNASGNGRLVYIGRLTRSKGVLVLASAAEKAGVGVDFVGNGECEVELKQRFPEARCWGWQSRDQTQEILRGSSLVVLPSLWPETFGLAVAEALSHGVPAIVSTRAGAAELISPGINGWLWNPRNADELPRLLSHIRDSQLMKVMSQGAIECYAKEEQGLDPHARDLSEVLSRIASGRLEFKKSKSCV